MSWRTVRGGPRAIRLKPVQLTTSPGIDSGGSFSPDGNFAGVTAPTGTGRFEIYTRPVLRGSGREVQITSNGNQNIEPAWSPDGKWIAFHSAAAHGIWIVPAGGGTPRQISTFGSAPAWSPDSSSIAFRSLEPYSFALFDLPGVGRVDHLDGGARWLAPAQAHDRTEPAGTTRLSELESGRAPRAVQCPVAASHLVDDRSGFGRTAPGVYRNITCVTASPFLRPMAGSTSPALPVGAASSIHYVRKSSAEPVELHDGSSDQPLQVAVSHDGRRLSRGLPASASCGRPAATRRLRRSIATAWCGRGCPRFRPTGGGWRTWFSAGGARRAMDDECRWLGRCRRYRGSRSAKRRRLVERRQGDSLFVPRIRRGAVAAHRPRRWLATFVAADHRSDRTASCDAGRARCGVLAGTPTENLWKLSLASRRPRQLTYERENSSFPSISWNGQWIAYESQKGNTTQIKVIDRDGSGQVQLTDDDALNWSNSWAADNRRVAFASFRSGVWNIWSMSRVTKERKQITHHTAFGSFTRNPAWRPGTEEIVYEHWLVKGNIYMAEIDR